MNAMALSVAPPRRRRSLTRLLSAHLGKSWRGNPSNDGVLTNSVDMIFDGLFSANVAPGPLALLLLVWHVEDKKYLCWAAAAVPGNGAAARCYCSFDGGLSNQGVHIWCTAFICAKAIGVINFSAMGLCPLAWPTCVYLLTAGGKASYGMRQPDSLPG